MPNVFQSMSLDFMEITLFFLLFLLWITASIFFGTLKNGISPMPSSKKAVKAIAAAIPPHLKGKIVDLGSGWGSLAFALAAEFPKNVVEGYETSLVPYVFCRLMNLVRRKKNLHFYKKDLFSASLQEAEIVICYLYPAAMVKLKEKFECELTTDAIVISNTFGIHGWIPEKTIPIDDLYKTIVYVYKKGSQK